MNDEKDYGATDLSVLSRGEEEVILYLAGNRDLVTGKKFVTVKDILDATGISEDRFYEFCRVAWRSDLFTLSGGDDTPSGERPVSANYEVITASRRILDRRANRAANAVKWLCRQPTIGPVIGWGQGLSPLVGLVGGICGIIGVVVSIIVLLRNP